MSSGRDRAWRAANVVLWALVAALFHAAVLLAVCYWPIQRPGAAGPINVTLIEAANPYLAGPDAEASAMGARLEARKLLDPVMMAVMAGMPSVTGVGGRHAACDKHDRQP